MTAIGDAIRAHARTTPDALAIDDGRGSLSWAELAIALDQAIDDVGTHFRDRARPIGLSYDHGSQACIMDLALLEGGLASVVIPPFFTDAQCDHALAACGAQALITDVAGTASIRPLAGGAVPLCDGTARISFTSGSTGTPKGLCLSAEQMTGVARAVVDHVGDGHAGRHLALLPPGILLENIAGFYASMLAGGTYVARSQSATGLAHPFRPDFAAMLATIADERITSLILVPEYLAGLVTAMEAGGIGLPALTLVAVGGARVPPSLIERAVALSLPVRQGYGLTECGSVVALEDGAENVRGSVGRSIGRNAIRIAANGEILIDGPAYLGAIGAPRAHGPLHSGDIGHIDDQGLLWIEGRKSNLIITSHGRNISPEWVEGLLLTQPAIAQAMVHGEGEAELSALIVPRTPDTDVARAIANANAALPAYARIARWRIVAPFTSANGHLTGNGRIRRDAIAATHLKGPGPMPFFDRLVAETDADCAILATVPQLQAGLSGRISRSTYIAYLTQAYHHVRHTAPLMAEARKRLADRPALVTALDDYIAEETGHEAWILADIEAAGADASTAAQGAPAAATAAMVDHAYDVVRSGNPAALFGMIYVLESTSVAMATVGADAVQATLGLPAGAFTYLTSHGALDQDHMRFFAELMNGIDDPADQQAIITMARDMYGLFAGMFAAIPLEMPDAAA